MLTVNAHDADVNVLSWNKQTTFMMASGADDGSLRAWDLRSFTDGGYVANFTYHRYAGLLHDDHNALLQLYTTFPLTSHYAHVFAVLQYALLQYAH